MLDTPFVTSIDTYVQNGSLCALVICGRVSFQGGHFSGGFGIGLVLGIGGLDADWQSQTAKRGYQKTAEAFASAWAGSGSCQMYYVPTRCTLGIAKGPSSIPVSVGFLNSWMWTS
jgi:hypothetical protein